MPGTKFKQISKPPLTKPVGVSEQQWQKALDLYQTSKQMGDAYPELTVAQAALETGWFRSPSGNYNYFGQKAGKGQQSVTLKTKEEGSKGLYSTSANFRSYNSSEEALQDRLDKWGSKYKDAENVTQALDIIVKNGYATASNYRSSVGPILNSITGNKINFSSSQNNPEKNEEPTEVYKPYLPTSSVALEASTAKYEEPKTETMPAEVAQARQELNEKSFIEELGSIFQNQEETQPPQSQQEFTIDPSFYNYIDEENY